MMQSEDFKIERVDRFQNFFGADTKAWIADGVILYTSIGSSTCPPIVERVEEKEDGIHLFTKSYSGMIGTADMVPVVQHIEHSDSTPIDHETRLFLDGVEQKKS